MLQLSPEEMEDSSELSFERVLSGLEVVALLCFSFPEKSSSELVKVGVSDPFLLGFFLLSFSLLRKVKRLLTLALLAEPPSLSGLDRWSILVLARVREFSEDGNDCLPLQEEGIT